MKNIKYIAAALLMVVLYCAASTDDWSQAVIQSMSIEEYEQAVEALGDTASDYEIAKYYTDKMSR